MSKKPAGALAAPEQDKITVTAQLPAELVNVLRTIALNEGRSAARAEEPPTLSSPAPSAASRQ